MKKRARQSARTKVAAVVATTALVLTGCSRASEDAAVSDPDGASVNNERVATLGLGDVDTALALGVVPNVVAPFGSEGDVGPEGVGPWATDALGDARPELIFDTGAGMSAEAVEKIIAADPTNILAVNTVVEPSVVSQLENVAPLTLKPSGATDWQIPWEDQVSSLARGLGKDEEGEKLLKKTNESVEKFRSAHPELQGKKAAAVTPFNGQISIYSAGDGRGQFIEDMGMTIPTELQSTETFYNTLSAENFTMLNDLDYLFVLDWGGAADELRKDPSFANLDIVKQDRVVWIGQDVGTAMSMPNPLTIPWALDKLSAAL